MTLSNSLGISHDYIKKSVAEGNIVIDATMGNGNDTVFLAELVGAKGHVYSFDIQKEALSKTEDKLSKNNLSDRVSLILDSHEKMSDYVSDKVQAIMFNLGYRPGGDHKISTKAETTIKAINEGLKLLAKNGIISVVIYHGGDTGFDERDRVLEYLKNLDCRNYSVLKHDFINQINCPPIAVIIEKLID